MRSWELKTLIPIPQSQIRNQCGGERARTADLLLAKQALSQTELHPPVSENPKSQIPNPKIQSLEFGALTW